MNKKIEYRPIQGEYDYLGNYSEGCIFVRNNTNEWKVGYIDKFGKIVVDMVYYGKVGDSYVHSPAFHDGLAALMNENGKFGYVDRTGRTVVPFIYDMTFCYSEGVASVKKDGKWGVIDRAGKPVVPFIYDCIAGAFENHQAEAILHGEKGYIDLNGYFHRQPIQPSKHIQALSREETPIPKAISVDYELITKFKYGLAVIKKDNRYGYVDRFGDIVIPIEYTRATAFSEGIAAVQKNGNWYILELV